MADRLRAPAEEGDRAVIADVFHRAGGEVVEGAWATRSSRRRGQQKWTSESCLPADLLELGDGAHVPRGFGRRSADRRSRRPSRARTRERWTGLPADSCASASAPAFSVGCSFASTLRGGTRFAQRLACPGCGRPRPTCASSPRRRRPRCRAGWQGERGGGEQRCHQEADRMGRRRWRVVTPRHRRVVALFQRSLLTWTFVRAPLTNRLRSARGLDRIGGGKRGVLVAGVGRALDAGRQRR